MSSNGAAHLRLQDDWSFIAMWSPLPYLAGLREEVIFFAVGCSMGLTELLADSRVCVVGNGTIQEMKVVGGIGVKLEGDL